MTRLVPVFLVAALLTACGAEADKPSASSTPKATPSATTPTTAPPAPALDMKEICPRVEAILPDVAVVRPDDLTGVLEALTPLVNEADLEAVNALERLGEGVEDAIEAGTTTDTNPAIAATRAWIGAVDAFARRCKAAGSSALQ